MKRSSNTALVLIGFHALIPSAFALRAQMMQRDAWADPNPDLPSDALKVRGLRLFLQLMYVRDKVSQRRQCLAAWNARLSDPEKWSILDVMWETRTSEYSRRLMKIAKGRDPPGIRSWAITILVYLEAKEPWQADDLEITATQALDKISGKNPSPYWR